MVGRIAALALGLVVALASVAQAEVKEVRLSKQFGLGYLPMIVIESQKLIEKHAAAAGLGEVATVWMQHAGPAVQIDALLAGQVDFIGPGVPTLATIWDRTVGTPQEVRALSAMQSMPYVLVTRNPNIKTIADFTDSDKIALPAVKLTGHALALEMAAAKLWGFENYDKLDALTITRSHADAAAALLSGMSEINSHFASSPFYYYELTKPGIHKVLHSYEVVGGKHTNGVLVAAKRFYRREPEDLRGRASGLQRGQCVHQGQSASGGGNLYRGDERQGAAGLARQDGRRSRGRLHDHAGQRHGLRGILAQGGPHQEKAGELEGSVLSRRARPERKLISQG